MTSQSKCRARLRGFSLVEVLIGSLVAMIGVGIYVGLQVYQARQDKAIDARLAALCEARAVMEAELARPVATLLATAEPRVVPPLALPPPLLLAPPGPSPRSPFRELPGAEVTCHVRPYAEPPPGPGLALEIEVQARWLEDGASRAFTLVTVRTDALALEGP